MAIEIEHTLTKCWVTVTEPHTFLEHPAYYAGKDNDPHYPVPAIASLMPLANPVVIYGLANNLWAQ